MPSTARNRARADSRPVVAVANNKKMFDDDVSDEDISAEALAAMFRRSREKDRAALDDFVATERSMRRDDSEGAARDQAVVGMYAAQRQRQRSAPDQVARGPRRGA